MPINSNYLSINPFVAERRPERPHCSIFEMFGYNNLAFAGPFQGIKTCVFFPINKMGGVRHI